MNPPAFPTARTRASNFTSLDVTTLVRGEASSELGTEVVAAWRDLAVNNAHVVHLHVPEVCGFKSGRWVRPDVADGY